jgi:glycosyltransferase involved in cell wall biosynthesis
MANATASISEPVSTVQGAVDLSILVPVYNEVENLEALHGQLHAVLSTLPCSYELIFVDDGSTDGSRSLLHKIAQSDREHVRAIFLRRNCGQTAALSAALDRSRGRVLIPIDGDLQNDPADIPHLLSKLDEGFDVVSGWRKDRKDRWLSRRVPSKIANRLVAKISGVALHDFGCTLKAYRREVLHGIRLYGEMHRFIPIYASWQGARVAEIVVNHRPRTAGRSKYGLGRTFNVVLDLMLIRFFQRYSQRPIHLFGRIGLWFFLLAFIAFCGMIYFKYWHPHMKFLHAWFGPGKTFVETPLPLLAVIFFLAGVQSILMGLMAEMVMRTYYESQSKTTYLVDDAGEVSSVN